MIKYIIISAFFIICGCSTTKDVVERKCDNSFSLKKEINSSIIDGFFAGDTIGKSAYLLPEYQN